ncbi:hypothetical protein HMPREF9057_01518 [Actinomyces sp. oral taxon 171 str. F0337]|nr:hypothetical protein HMPREF9057_01518 [Actinomyces sp. oral taxon 171 str. F0337]
MIVRIGSYRAASAGRERGVRVQIGDKGGLRVHTATKKPHDSALLLPASSGRRLLCHRFGHPGLTRPGSGGPGGTPPPTAVKSPLTAPREPGP